MESKSKKIGILGVGAIGSVLAFDLQRSEANELFHYSRTKKEEIKIKVESTEFEIPINLETTITASPKLDWLIICLKEHQYAEAKDWFLKLLDPTTKIAIIRNGLRLKAPMLNFASEQNILECIIDCPTQVIERGFYEQLRKPIITVQNNSLAKDFKNLFQKCQSDIRLVEDFKSESWKKIIESSALGAILCLSGETCWIFEDEKLRKLYVSILEEALRVAVADGAEIENNFVENMTMKLISYPETKGSSMLTDRLNGNPIELGAKNGIISELGSHYNVETPINDLIVQLLKHTNKKGSLPHQL
ncbi:MAG: hypothetical protein JKY54_13660 [Flavobacteriales bacterium]|nr:hypothetical protein [Flavobacteriales bacterium]